MPALLYRSMLHAVAGKGRYGYYQKLEDTTARGDELLITTKVGEQPYPLKITIQGIIHNHEDLDRFTQAVLDAYEALRGEHGEDEVRSPSVLVPFKK